MPIWWHTSHWCKQYPADSVVWSTVSIDTIQNTAASAKTNDLDFKLCPPYSAGRKGGRPHKEKWIKGAIEIAIDKTEKKKKKAETRKKRDPIEPKDNVEYRTVKKKRKRIKDTVAKQAQGKGKGKVAKKKGGERKISYKNRVTQPTTTSPKKKKARRGK